MATTIATESSILSVAADLVTERSVCIKVLLIAVYLVHLSGSIALVVLYALNVKQRALEFGLTLAFLVIGLIITSFVNLLGYHLSRSRRLRTRADGIVIERKDPEIAETSEAKWKSLRVICSILPLCPVIRYIECLYESDALMTLENKLLGTQPVMKKQFRETTSTVSTVDDARSMRSAVEENGLLEEKVQRSIRRQRRAFRRCEQGAARIGLLQAAVTAGPQAVLQICLLAKRDQSGDRFNLPMSDAEVKVVATCSITCIIWLAAALTQFYPARRVAADPDGEQSNTVRWFGQWLIFLWHLVMLCVRILPLALFASSFHFWILVPLVIHVAGCVVAHILYKRARPSTGFVNGGGVDRNRRMEKKAFDVFYIYVMIFDFINANEGRTRMRYLFYYAIIYVENMLLIVAWYCYMPMFDVWYRMAALMVTLSLFFVGFLFMQLYYLYFHPSSEGLTLCGACAALSAATRKSLYLGNVEQKVDPIVGGNLPRADMPYWVERDDVFGVPGAIVPPPMSDDTASSIGREGSTIMLVQPPLSGRSNRPPPISAMRGGGASKTKLSDNIPEVNQEAFSPSEQFTATSSEPPTSVQKPELKPRVKPRVTIAPESTF